MDGTSETAPRSARTGPLIVAAACLLAYANSCGGPFVFDDVNSLVENDSIRSLTTALRPPMKTTVTGRPVANLTLALNYALGGEAPLGYHVVNLAIHLLAALALLGLARRTLRLPSLGGAFARDGDRVALAIALLWALHPLQTESVTYVIQRVESLGGLFCLLTLYAFVRAVGEEPTSRAWLSVSVAACALGMGTKEVVASVPVLALFYDRAFLAGAFRGALARRRGYYLALALTWLVLGALVLGAGGRSGTAGFNVGYAWWEYGLTQIYAVTMYLRLALWPWPLNLDYGDQLHPVAWDLAPRALLLLALAAATAWALLRRPRWGFLGLSFFALLAPSSSIITIKTQTAAEHRMYLPLAAVVVAAILLARSAWRRVAPEAAWARKGPVAALAAVALTFGALTLARNRDYATEYSILYDILEKHPANARVHETLVLSHLQDLRPDRAFHHYDEAQRLQPNPDLAAKLAFSLLKADWTEQAEALLRYALKKETGARPLNVLGIALAVQGKTADAAESFRRASELAPDSAHLRENQQKALAGDRALAAYREKP